MKELIEKIEACNFQCEAGPLKNNIDWHDLKLRIFKAVDSIEDIGKLANRMVEIGKK